MASPKTKDKQAYSKPFGIKRDIKYAVETIFTNCSKILATAFFPFFLNAVKYPFNAEDIEIKGRLIAII